MKVLPEDDSDRADLTRLNVEPWMVEYLKLNPDYVYWGPGEDSMETKGKGWGASMEVSGWSAFGPWTLDDLNECVHFYFELERPSESCAACAASGYNPETKVLADTFYDHGKYGLDLTNRLYYHGDFRLDLTNGKIAIENARNPYRTTEPWHDDITQDEVDALVAEGRLRKWIEGAWQSVPRTAAEVNTANTRGAKHDFELNHDGINRGILIETRAKRLGVWACGRVGSVSVLRGARHGVHSATRPPERGALDPAPAQGMLPRRPRATPDPGRCRSGKGLAVPSGGAQRSTIRKGVG